MRILILTQWFDPEPACKGLLFARKLAERGHQVEVLTGFPNYPGGVLFPGYRLRMWQRERREGVSIIRVPLYPSHDRSAVRRAINYLSFAAAATFLGPILARRPDVIYAYHPPGTVGLPALALGAYFSVPVIYDVQDLWPDTLVSTGMVSDGWGLRLAGRLCRLVYRRADRVVVLSPGFRKALIARGVAPEKVQVIYNWAAEERLAVSPKPRSDGRLRIVFAGNIGLAQGLDAVLDAATRCAVTVPHAEFLMMGGGVDAERLKQRASALRLSNVGFLGRQPVSAAQAILNAADILLVHLKDDPLFEITIPSKTQAYLAAGRPILMAVRGDAADLVTRAGAGVLAQPGDADSIALAVHQLAGMTAEGRSRLGRNGREFYERELAIDPAVTKYEEAFRDALQPLARTGANALTIGNSL